jgi:hypothetical protein
MISPTLTGVMSPRLATTIGCAGSQTALSVWFRVRVGAIGGRIRKIMIVALARKLLDALWRYVTDGVVPDGAKMKAA